MVVNLKDGSEYVLAGRASEGTDAGKMPKDKGVPHSHYLLDVVKRGRRGLLAKERPPNHILSGPKGI